MSWAASGVTSNPQKIIAINQMVLSFMVLSFTVKLIVLLSLLRSYDSGKLVLTVQGFDFRLIHAEEHIERCLRGRQPIRLLVFAGRFCLEVDRGRAIGVSFELVVFWIAGVCAGVF